MLELLVQGLRVPIEGGGVSRVWQGGLVATPRKAFQEFGKAGLKVLV